MVNLAFIRPLVYLWGQGIELSSRPIVLCAVANYISELLDYKNTIAFQGEYLNVGFNFSELRASQTHRPSLVVEMMGGIQCVTFGQNVQ